MSRPAPVNSSDSSGGEHLHWGKSPLAEPMVRDSADRQRPCDGRTSAPSFLHRRCQIPRRAFVRFDFRKSDELFRGEAQMKNAVDDGDRRGNRILLTDRLTHRSGRGEVDRSGTIPGGLPEFVKRAAFIEATRLVIHGSPRQPMGQNGCFERDDGTSP